MEADKIDGETKFCSDCGSQINTKAEVCPECGVSQQTSHTSQREPSGRWIAAFIGSIVSFVLGWLPFVGPILGGGLAGYLRGQNNRESAITGTIANIIASIPFFFFAIFGVFAQILEGTVGTFVGWVFLVVISLTYFYGCGAVGGWIGSEFSNRAQPDR